MTSWVNMRSPVKKTAEPLPAFYYATSEKGITRSFIDLLVSYITAQKNAERLHVYDKSSLMGDTFSLFEGVFEKTAAITFLKTPSPANNLENSLQESLPLVTSIRPNRLRELTSELFRWNGVILNRIRERMEQIGISRTLFDVGIHLRSNLTIPVKNYVEEVRKYQKMTNKKNISLFITTDSFVLLELFRKLADPTWKIVSLCSKETKSYDPNDIKDLAFEKKRKWLDTFLTELFIMQHTPYVLLNLTTAVGQFLYLTTRSQFPSESIVSLDGPTWSPSLLFNGPKPTA